MSVERLFGESGIAPEDGASLLRLMNVDFDELEEVNTWQKVKRVLSYYGSYPDGVKQARKLVGHKDLDKLTFLNEYINVRTELSDAEQELDLQKGYLNKGEKTEKLSEIKELKREAKLYEK